MRQRRWYQYAPSTFDIFRPLQQPLGLQLFTAKANDHHFAAEVRVKGASIVSLQDEKHVGFKSMVDDILQVAERHLAKLNRNPPPGWRSRRRKRRCRRTAYPPPVQKPGRFPALVRCGATVMFSEVTEVRDAIHLLTPRAINEEVGKRFFHHVGQPAFLVTG
jgi:galactarate dehydratase